MAKVFLLKTNGMREAWFAAKRCYSSELTEDLIRAVFFSESDQEQFLADKILAKGHMQVLENIVFWFGIDGVSRACAHQIVRTRMSSICEKSLRRTDVQAENAFCIPQSIIDKPFILERVQNLLDSCNSMYGELVDNGIPREDARCVLPLATKTSLHITLNFSSFWNMLKNRTCKSTQSEYRNVAEQMLELAKMHYPILLKNAGPPCNRGEKCIGASPCKS
jgi:thymidylate synthase (FAD)